MKSFNLTSKLIYSLITAVTFSLAAVAPATAQDTDEPGRYRPQGREIARAIGNEFDEALYEVRTYDPRADVDEFASATIFYPLTLSFAAPSGGLVYPLKLKENIEASWWLGILSPARSSVSSTLIPTGR